MPRTILFIDDDERIQKLLGTYFQKNGFNTLAALTGTEGIELLQTTIPEIDIIILDLMLPEIDGFETLRLIRKTCDTPVIMLTARDDETDRIVGLEMGADDYLHKPLNPRELLARIKVVLRRTQKQATVTDSNTPKIQSQGIIIDSETRQITMDNKELHFSTVEFDLLFALIESKGRVISRDQLMTLARGRDFEAFDRSVDVHISRIRKKIETDPSKPERLKTIWGKGYMWADSP